MSMYKNLTTVCAAAALALGLAACGGGGGGDDDTADAPTTMEPMPMPPPTASVMIPDAMYLDEDNAPAAMTHMIAAGEMATNNGVIFSCPAGGDACEVEVMADGSVTSTGGEATAALSADAMVQVAQAKKDEADMQAAAMLMRRDRVIGEDRALEAANNIGTGGGPAETAILISRAPSAMARVRSTGYSAAEEAALPNGDWAGTRLTQAVPGTGTNQLVVYTDIEAPTRIQFYNWDGDAMTPSLYADATVTDILTQPADASTAITPLALGGAGATFSAGTTDPTKFPRPLSPEEGSDTQTYRVNDDSDADNTNDRVSIPGNYNGAGGRYLCTPAGGGTTCSVTVAPSGAYTSGDTWTFTPELNSTAWLQDGGTAAGAGGGQIGDFMSFGWWLQTPTAQTGVYTFRYYADGTPYQLASASGNLAVGSATYTGRAAGRYAMQEIDDTGVIDGMTGEFTAAASLTARFNGTAAGGTLQGTISGFQGEHEEVSGWSVTLNRQTIAGAFDANATTTGTNNDPTASGFDGATATMGDQTAHGTWTSQFFGLPANDGGSADAYPLGVGGTFQADNEAASIAGAFGARR